jgi:hypothetical protein
MRWLIKIFDFYKAIRIKIIVINIGSIGDKIKYLIKYIVIDT